MHPNILSNHLNCGTCTICLTYCYRDWSSSCIFTFTAQTEKSRCFSSKNLGQLLCFLAVILQHSISTHIDTHKYDVGECTLCWIAWLLHIFSKTIFSHQSSHFRSSALLSILLSYLLSNWNMNVISKRTWPEVILWCPHNVRLSLAKHLDFNPLTFT